MSVEDRARELAIHGLSRVFTETTAIALVGQPAETISVAVYLTAIRAIVAALRQHATEAAQLGIPDDIVDQVLSMGPVEWGATARKVAAEHVAEFAETLRLTREHFNFEDVPVAMHGLYLKGLETVLCHTGTSPNSPGNAQALAGAWNWLHDRCAEIRTPDPAPQSGGEV